MSHYYFTETGYKKIKDEIEELERFIKVDIPRDLATAAAHGDLRENAEYHAAKDKQAVCMAKLAQLRSRIAKGRVVLKEELPVDTVTLGKTVTIKQVDTGEESKYTILGEGESDLSKGIISYASPLARSLIGLKKGEAAEVDLPMGLTKFEVLAVENFE